MAWIDWDIPVRCKGWRKMNENEVAITFRQQGKSTYYNLTLNQSLTRQIKEKGFSKILIKQDDITGEIGLFFNEEKGVKLSTTGNKESFNYKLDNKTWISSLCDVLGLSKDGKRHVLSITTNLSKKEDSIFVRILN